MKNNFFIKNEYIEICFVNKKEICIIDVDDFDTIKKYNWSLDKNGYVVARTKDFGTTRITIHNLIIRKNNKSNHIDHINCNKLDNRKINLRECTHSQNKMNRPKQSNNSSGIKGVYFDKSRKKWGARILLRNNILKQKRFNSKEEAIDARKKWEEELFGEFNYKQ